MGRCGPARADRAEGGICRIISQRQSSMCGVVRIAHIWLSLVLSSLVSPRRKSPACARGWSRTLSHMLMRALGTRARLQLVMRTCERAPTWGGLADQSCHTYHSTLDALALMCGCSLLVGPMWAACDVGRVRSWGRAQQHDFCGSRGNMLAGSLRRAPCFVGAAACRRLIWGSGGCRPG